MMKDVITPPQHLYPYRWFLEDTVFTKDKGKVFSCFACGGGSTMGLSLIHIFKNNLYYDKVNVGRL